MHPSEWFDAVFLGQGREEDFWRGEARGVEDPILVFPCGTGDLAIALAKDGHEVIGLDHDALMLARTLDKLRAEPIEVRESVCLGLSDLTQYTGRYPYTSTIFVPRNGWWCLENEAARRQALDALGRRLEEGGLLTIDGFNVITEERTGGRQWSKMHHAPKAYLSDFNRWREISCEVRQDGDQHIETFSSSDGVADTRELGVITLTCPTHEQMQREIEESGTFEIEEVYGNWDRQPFNLNDHEGRQIWVLSKK